MISCFLPIGFVLQDSYRINSYRICFYESNNMCSKFSYRIKILYYSYAIPTNQRSPQVGRSKYVTAGDVRADADMLFREVVVAGVNLFRARERQTERERGLDGRKLASQ
jgi:hypothetical protein